MATSLQPPAIRKATDELSILATVRSATVIFVAAMFLASGCSRGHGYLQSYGYEYNAERSKRGISTIPTNWTAQDLGDTLVFFDPTPDQSKPYHLSKRVTVDSNGMIKSETDEYYSGRTFLWPAKNEQLPQKIEITYDFSAETNGNPWTIYGSLESNHFIARLSLKETDGILTTWGLKR